jgi:hypothetical protein
MKKSAAFSFLLAVSVLSFLCAAGQIYLHFDYREDVVSETKLELQKLTDKAARDIEAILRQTMNDADALADELTAPHFCSYRRVY